MHRGLAQARQATPTPDPQSAVFCRTWSHQEMNKAELNDAIAAAADISKAEAGRAIDAFVSEVTKALKKGDSVTLVGFGTFQVRDRAERTGRNPKTGDSIKIAASKNPTFKAGKALKDAVN
ncbi:HU family DNA-binding protein [Xanthomonas sacchari]|uniref:HU family DNA-binding protein n=1 Tax=Xanthomonas sacchari TaxID=56458 RepID=UPI001CC58EAF|nr:HU family DNA-binding protein [Xanthomonas sacchari]MCC4592536.1 HU family DNA-binding protein [Xanthomonas campestris pv. cannae]